jgi:hypothetical protein
MTITEFSHRVRRSAFMAAFWVGLAVLTPWSSSAAGRATVVWDPSPGTNVISDYKIYFGIASGTYTNAISAGTNTTLSVSNLVGGKTYYFAATAVDSYGLESDYSVEGSALIPVAAPNQPPTLDPIVNLTINENSTFQTIHLSGITPGATNETQTLVVTAASSNPALIPTPAVDYASPSTTGSITFTPALFGYGSSTVTVTVNDGAGSNNIVSRAFTVTVNPVNLAPTLSPVADLAINEGAGLQTVNLSGIGAGAPNEDQTLTMTASSSNPALIPTPTVAYASPNTTGSISFTPTPFMFGTATVSVTVNDGGASNNVFSRTFTVTVNSVNQSPTLDALANVGINENDGQQVVNLFGISSGASNEIQTLTVTASSSNPTLIPAPTVSYVSPNATGSIAFAPLTNTHGTATITVTVDDGAANNHAFSRSFVVSVAQASARPVDCAYTLVLNPAGFSPNAASGTFSIGAASSCAWSLVAPAWVSLSTTNGSGSGSGTFTVEANIGPDRSGVVTLQGSSTNISCTITQQALAAGAVALATPLDTAVSKNSRPQFSWVQPDPPATKYYLLINRDGGKYLDQWVEGSTNWTASSDLTGGSYTWAVQTWNGENAGLWSTNSAFTIEATTPSSAVALLSPIGMTRASTSLRFSWKTVPAATRYQLHIESAGIVFFDQNFNLPDSLVDSSTGEFAVALNSVTAGSYVWWVRGWSPAGYGPWSERGSANVYR